jgi:hypothetical protein
LTIAKERIEGALSGLNQISLKSRLNNFITKHMKDINDLQQEDLDSVVSYLVNFRNARSHGQIALVRPFPYGYDFLRLKHIMQELVRSMIISYVFE